MATNRDFPENTPNFEKLYGLREDVEAHHAKFKRHLWGKRARTADPELNRLDMAMGMLIENTRARMANHQRLDKEAAGPPLARTGQGPVMITIGLHPDQRRGQARLNA